MASGATGVAWADQDSASGSSSSDNQSVSRPDAAPSDTSPSRGKKKTTKKDSSAVNGDTAEAEDAPSRSHRRATAPKADRPARSTTEDAGEEPTVERADTPAAVEKPAESAAPTRVSTSRPARKVVTSTTVVTAPPVETANDTKATVELDQPAEPVGPATPDAPAGTGMWTLLSAASRESRRTLFNRRPVLDNQQVDVTLDEYDDVSVPISFGGSDPDDDPLTYRVARGKWFGPKHGTVTVDQATGTFTYDADNEFALTGGRDRFLVRVSDYDSDDFHLHGLFSGHGKFAFVTVVVAPTDRAPVAGSDSVTVDEDGLLVIKPSDLLANDSDADGDDLTVEGYTQPEHGNLWINRDGTISYDPDDDFNGTDTFTYTVSDGTKTATATVSVTVNPVNDAPVANNDTVAVDEDGLLIVNPADLLANDTDIDRDNLSIDGYTQPEHGNLWINRDGTISYNPDDDFNGTDTFTYTVTDGTETATATVTVTVNAVNDAPVAVDDTVAVDEDGLLIVNPADLLANDTDIDGDDLTVEGYTQPEHGALWINRDGTISYNPDADFNGTDTFTYTVSDGTQSVTATVTITVNAVDDAPVATDDTLEATEDTPLTFSPVTLLGNDTDVDSDTLTVVIGAAPTNGTLVQNADGTYTYTPNADFNGTDSFTYSVSDGSSTSALATVTINVAAVDDGPVAANDSLSATEDNPLTFTPGALLGNDASTSGGTLSVDSFTQPANGTLVLNANGTFTYTPNANFFGVDTFTYTATDGTLTSGSATVSVNVAGVDDAPVITGVNVGAADPSSAEVRGSITATDPDGGAITYSAPTTTQYGTVTIDPNTGAFVYTPNEDSREGGGANGGTISLTDPAQVTQGTFDSVQGGLFAVSQLPERGATRNYIATFFTATATQTYTFGQSQAPVDTVMIVYSGTFDPSSPQTGALVLNDDSQIHAVPVTGCGGNGSLCPEVTLNLVAGQRVSIVVTTYGYDEPLGLPQSFYATGPGGFSTKPQEDTFVVTATDSSGATSTTSVTVPIAPLPAVSAL
ncbi:hypothetical protein EB72_13760 [Mycobacterium sp. SWH-M1]|nr:hypothetical protein EB72_13760 [Mycobacterium sp. SWH-M1]